MTPTPETSTSGAREPDASRRSDRARRAILSATRELISDVGYARLSIEGIASAAGVGKQTIYRWWRSKAAVVFDAILEANSQDGGSVALPDTGDFESDLRAVLRGTVAALTEPATDRLQRAITAEIQTDLVVADELVHRLLRPQLDATAARITAAVQAGQAGESVNPQLAAELLFGPVFHRWLLRTGPLDDEFADGVLAMVLAGLWPR